MNSVLTQFIKNELDAYIQTQRVPLNQDMVNLIMRAFEAYEEYKRLVSSPKAKPLSDPFRCKHGWRLMDGCSECSKGYGQDI